MRTERIKTDVLIIGGMFCSIRYRSEKQQESSDRRESKY